MKLSMFSNVIDDKRWVFLISLTLTVLVFGNTFANKWTYDDVSLIIDNPDAHSLSEFLENRYPSRPLRELSYMLDYKLFGNEPAGYHVQQLLWHALNGLLLFCLARVLSIQPLWALMGMALFLLHPLQAESVANIGHRKELLPLFFGLLCMLTWAGSAGKPMPLRICLRVLSGVSYFVALLANVTIVTLPGAIVLYEYLFVEEDKRLFLRKPFVAEIIALVAMTGLFFYLVNFSTYQQNTTVLFVQNGFLENGPYHVLVLALFKAFALYVSKLFIPTNLAPEYAIELSKSFVQWQAWLGLALLLAIAGSFVLIRRRNPITAFGLGWFLMLYVPISNAYPSAYIMADRYMYMCLPGVSLALAGLLQQRPSRRLTVVATLLLLSLATLTIIQNRHWRNEHTLAKHAAEVNPNSSGANWMLAESALKRDEYELAQKHSRRVLEINRFFMPAYLFLGEAEEGLGNYESALENYEFFARFGVASDPMQAAMAARRAQRLRAWLHANRKPR